MNPVLITGVIKTRQLLLTAHKKNGLPPIGINRIFETPDRLSEHHTHGAVCSERAIIIDGAPSRLIIHATARGKHTHTHHCRRINLNRAFPRSVGSDEATQRPNAYRVCVCACCGVRLPPPLLLPALIECPGRGNYQIMIIIMDTHSTPGMLGLCSVRACVWVFYRRYST